MSIFILPLGGAESAYFIFCIVLPDNEVGPYLLFSRNQKPKRGACMVWGPASYRVRVPPALSALCPGCFFCFLPVVRFLGVLGSAQVYACLQ